jgi:hypothetical protein
MKTGSPRMVRYTGYTLNLPLSLIYWHSPFCLLLLRQ